MPRKPNEQIGVCPCPVTGCEATRAPLFQFQNTAKAGATRKAGKYYGRCPHHGWFGYDAAPAMQAYIRKHGKLNEGTAWETDEKSAAPASAPSAPSAPSVPSAPKSQPAKPQQPAPSKRQDVWDL